MGKVVLKTSPGCHLWRVLIAIFMLGCPLFLHPSAACADVWSEIDKAWNEAKEYLDIRPALDKAIDQCGQVTEEASEQISQGADTVAKQLDVDKWISSGNVSEYEKRAASELRSIEEYEERAVGKIKQTRRNMAEQSLD